MRLTLSAIVAAAALLCCVPPGSAQEETPAMTATLERLSGPDGKTVEVDTVMRRGRAGQADLALHGGPYFRTGTESSAGTLWYISGANCQRVTGIESTGKELATELVRSGGKSFLTRVRAGANEFFWLDGADAKAVTFEDGEPFHERARITRGGKRAILYTTTFEGELRLHEVSDGVAKPIAVKDKRDHGAIMYAWDVGEVIVAGFHKEGSYSFRALRDGFFRSTMGDADPSGDVSAIHAERFGDTLFLNILRPAEVSEHWVFDGEVLKLLEHEDVRQFVRWDRPAIRAVNEHGLYATAIDKRGHYAMFRCDAESVERVLAGELFLAGPTVPTVYGKGGSVFVQYGTWGEYLTYMLRDADARLVHMQEGRRPEWCTWLGSLEGFELLQYSASDKTVALGAWQDGDWLQERIQLDGAPEDFGEITKAWNAGGNSICVLEWSGSEHRLWRLTLNE